MMIAIPVVINNCVEAHKNFPDQHCHSGRHAPKRSIEKGDNAPKLFSIIGTLTNAFTLDKIISNKETGTEVLWN